MPEVAFWLFLFTLFILVIIFAYVLLDTFFEEQRTNGKLDSENKYFNHIKYYNCYKNSFNPHSF